jgi:hypothetical protein
MPGRDDQGRSRQSEPVLALLVALSLFVASDVFGQDALRLIGTEGTALERAVTEAAREAQRKLALPSCQLVFSDFRSVDGRRLTEVLNHLGQDARTYFRGLDFYDGNGRPICATRDILASTIPGSRAVFVCSIQFLNRSHSDRGLAAVLLIHEELHALGLGENPPSSREITQKVIQRCGK